MTKERISRNENSLSNQDQSIWGQESQKFQPPQEFSAPPQEESQYKNVSPITEWIPDEDPLLKRWEKEKASKPPLEGGHKVEATSDSLTTKVSSPEQTAISEQKGIFQNVANRNIDNKHIISQRINSQNSRAAKDPKKEEELNRILNLQRHLKPHRGELYDFWETIKKQKPTVAAEIEKEVHLKYDHIFDYAVVTSSSLDIGKRAFDWTTVIFEALINKFPQPVNDIISGKTYERREKQRQSLSNLGRATQFSRLQLNNFYQGKDDSTNYFGGIRNASKRAEVDEKAFKIFERLTIYDKLEIEDGDYLKSKEGQKLYQACRDAALLLMFREAREIIGGNKKQRESLNQIFNSLPKVSPAQNPNSASQDLINKRSLEIFQAITNQDSPKTEADKELFTALRNANILQWNVKNARNVIYGSMPNISGKKIGVWIYRNQRISIIGGNPITRSDKNSFENFQDAAAYTHVKNASQNEKGGVIIKQGKFYYAFTINFDFMQSFYQGNIKDGSTFFAEKNEGIQAFVAADGYTVTNIKAVSDINAVPVNPTNAPNGLQNSEEKLETKNFPSESGYQTILKDLATDENNSINENGYVALFNGLLKVKALKLLDENRRRLLQAKSQYSSNNSKAPQNLNYLRSVIKKDQELANVNKNYNSIIGQKEEARKIRDEAPSDSEKLVGRLIRETEPLKEKVNMVKQVRATLRTFYPALAVPDIDKNYESTSDNILVEKINNQFNQVLDAIDKTYIIVHNGSAPLTKFDQLVTETLQQISITRDGQDSKSQAVLNFLFSESKKEAITSFSGALASFILGIGSFFTSGFTSFVLGLASSGIGAGTAAYELDQADKLNTAATSGELGGKPLVDNPEVARFNYVMGWVNLFLAGLDIGLTIGGELQLLKKAEIIANIDGASILAKLSPEQITALEKARQYKLAGKADEAQPILQQLKKELGEDFEKATQFWDEVGNKAPSLMVAQTLEEALPKDLRNKISIQVRDNLQNKVEVRYELNKNKKLISKIYIVADKTATVRDIQLHVDTVRYMQQYAGINGRIRLALDRLEQFWNSSRTPKPKPGSRGWEAIGELEKLPGIILDRAEQLVKGNFSDITKEAIENDILDLKALINENLQILNETAPGSGVGAIAMPLGKAPGNIRNAPLTQKNHPEVFWRAWDIVEQYNDKYLLVTGLGCSDNISLLQYIIERQLHKAPNQENLPIFGVNRQM